MSKMSDQKILILDYSVDRIEAAAIKCWLPVNSEVAAVFIDTAESFPDDLIFGYFLELFS